MKKTIALLLALALVLGACGGEPAPEKNEEPQKLDVLKSDALIENDRFSMNYAQKTGEITVSDKQTGTVYSSRLATGEGEAVSEIALTYYDSQSVKYTMNSFDNSVNLGMFESFKDGDGVQVHYSFKEPSADILVPAVLTVQKYEELKEKMSSSEARKLSMNYELIYTDDTSKRADALKEKYPYLKKNDLYIVFDNLLPTEKSKLSEAFKSAGYSSEQYLADIDAMGISRSEIKIPTSFEVYVKYGLSENGLTAEVLLDKLTCDGAGITLQSISLLPSFSAKGTDPDSYVLADGSGVTAFASGNSDETFSRPIYGGDRTIASENTTNLTSSYCLPMAGWSSNAGSFMAVVNTAAEAGYINAEFKGTKNLYNRLYVSFDVQAMDLLSIRPGSNISEVNYYSGKALGVNPQVEYYLLPANTDSNGFAKYYRETVKDSASGASGSLIFLEFTGYRTMRVKFMGIPMQKKVVLSTLSEIKEEVDYLIENGVRNISVRLKGFGNHGENHGVANTFKIDRSVGTEKELAELAKTITDNGGKLYFENDVSLASKDYAFDGFTPSKDNVRALSGAMTYLKDFDIVNLDFSVPLNTRYIVSAKKYPTYMESFVKQFKKSSVSDSVNLSWSSGAKWIFSDFNDKNIIDRTDALGYITETMADIKGNFGSMMSDGGNIYALPYVDTFLNVPLYGSNYSISDRVDGLYQMVMHGLVDYTGEALNLSIYPDKLRQRSVETGSAFLYSCVTRENAYRKFSAYQNVNMFPTDISTQREKIIEEYSAYGAFYKAKAESSITSLGEVAPGVVKTEYSNGLYSIVNNSEKEITVDGINLAAGGIYTSEVRQ